VLPGADSGTGLALRGAAGGVEPAQPCPALKLKISRRAGCGAWCSGEIFVRLAIRSICPDGVCMPRPASKLDSPRHARTRAGACAGRLTQQKLGSGRWGEEE
jgi:hypothetical protein